MATAEAHRLPDQDLVSESQIDCDVLSCVRPDFHATSATPLATTVRNAAQIANEIVAHFQIEFFNSIAHKAVIQTTRKTMLRIAANGQGLIRRSKT